MFTAASTEAAVQVIFSRAAQKALRKMSGKDALAMVEKLETYGLTGAGDVIKLTGAPFYRLRHGEWRAIFEIEGAVMVVRVAHRRESHD